MKYLIVLMIIASGAVAGEVGNYPNAGALGGSERMLADQNSVTVDITPLQIQTYICSNFPYACAAPSLASIVSVVGCSNSIVLGGTAQLGTNVFIGAGSFNVGASGTCTAVITFAQTANHDWYCSGNDMTSQVLFLQSARSATSCTITGSASSSDTIVFQATGY